MTPIIGGKSFFTAAELAEMKLPGLSSKRKINERAKDERWVLKFDKLGAPLHRERRGRGGGVEYHVDLLPAAARVELAKRGLAGVAEVHAGPPPELQPASLWPWFEAQTDKVKAEAKRRLAILDALDRAERAGMTRTAAVALVSGDYGVSSATLWGWFRLVTGVAPSDRLPHLAPRRKGGGVEVEIDDTIWTILKSDWLRAEKPTFESCYQRALLVATSRGLTLPCVRTLKRRLEREVPAAVVLLRREGPDAVRQVLPAQRRSVEQLHALELVNIDGHKWDVFVRFPNGEIGRPIMVAIQDVYSRKLLAWRFGDTESAVLTRLAFADLFRNYGIPKGCLLDNGRAFASKWITGGAKTRFRFKIREDEPTGLLPGVGINPHWALPYRGSSKPIERTFGIGGIAGDAAKHPAFAGAYTGNSPENKPHNYNEKNAIDWDVFVRVANSEIARLNAKPNRATEMGKGIHSFDDVFNASYANAIISKAGEEQLRLALLTADDVSTDRKTGEIRYLDNRYWAPELSQIAGDRVVVRFDPDDLTLPMHVYSRDGRPLVSAPLVSAVQFLDVQAAKTRMRQEREHRKAVRQAEKLQNLMDAADIAAMLPRHENAAVPEPTVMRPVRHRGSAATAARPIAAEVQEQLDVRDRIGAAVRKLRIVQ